MQTSTPKVNNFILFRKTIFLITVDYIIKLIGEDNYEAISKFSGEALEQLSLDQLSEFKLCFGEDGFEHEGGLNVYLKSLNNEQLKRFCDEIIPDSLRTRVYSSMSSERPLFINGVEPLS